jgi:hypothetical protein
VCPVVLGLIVAATHRLNWKRLRDPNQRYPLVLRVENKTAFRMRLVTPVAQNRPWNHRTPWPWECKDRLHSLPTEAAIAPKSDLIWGVGSTTRKDSNEIASGGASSLANALFANKKVPPSSRPRAANLYLIIVRLSFSTNAFRQGREAGASSQHIIPCMQVSVAAIITTAPFLRTPENSPREPRVRSRLYRCVHQCSSVLRLARR